MLPGFPNMIGGLQPKGVEINNNLSAGGSGTLFAIPEGVTEVAMMLVANGGRGSASPTTAPGVSNMAPGGGGGWASSDAIAVEPGYSVRYRTTNFADGRHRIEIYFFGVNGNATVLAARKGQKAFTDTTTAVAGIAGMGTVGDILRYGTNGTSTNRGGSAGATPSAISNTTSGSPGFGVVPGADGWTYELGSGQGRGGIPVYPNSYTGDGGALLVIAWGLGKGFNAGPGSYWPNV